MQSSLAGISLFILFLSHQGAGQFLEEPCGTIIGSNGIYSGLQKSAPWMAVIRNASDYLCAGTLIHRRFVLGTAQCLMNQFTLLVRLAAHGKAQAYTEYTATQALMHRSFNKLTQQNDIGLLKLSSSVVFDDHIYPICIVLDKRINDHIEMIGTFKSLGWGPSRSDLEFNELHTVTVNKVSEIECQRHSGDTHNKICGRMPFACWSDDDSGNPLTTSIAFNETTDLEVQFGIASYGRSSCEGPIIFTNVTSYVDWIEETINRFYAKETPLSSPEEPKLKLADAVTPKPNQIQMVRDIWLYSDCGGDTIESHLLAFVYGGTFQAHGVFVTDKFVLTIARELPDNLFVGPMALNRTLYTPLKVEWIFRHPQYLDDGQNDIALLKLEQSVAIGGLKPICVLTEERYQPEAESSSPFTLFATKEINQIISIYEHDVELVGPGECSYNIQGTIGQNQLCIAGSPQINENYGKHGDLLGIKMWYSGREWLSLIGIVSYSTNGLHVLTNVMRHTAWITHVVSTN
ncbi:serine protease 53-like [Drosophila elegans]|uniref:serine protease 53-like n=1 Tax=Drosophila elegans TaxID=30023 RepID=UPI001BC853FF|nr:serine protease 53-like [Drosophila elegans]